MWSCITAEKKMQIVRGTAGWVYQAGKHMDLEVGLKMDGEIGRCKQQQHAKEPTGEVSEKPLQDVLPRPALLPRD